MATAVHLFTASGVVWGFLALLAASQGDIRAMFGWLLLALFVDGVDGTFARKVDITNTAPRYSGEVLDLVVDYLTYVIVPAYALFSLGWLPPGWNLVASVIILLTSALYFADNEMKTEDAWFKGFPAVWNLVLFYIILLAPGPVFIFVTVVVLGALSFAPIVFVHPFRVSRLREVTLTLVVVWTALAAYAVWRFMTPEVWVVWALSLIGLYFVVLGYFRTPPSVTGA